MKYKKSVGLKWIFILLALSAFASLFQNCSSKFSQINTLTSNQKSLISSSTANMSGGGNGLPYEGKTTEYKRILPGYQCGGKEVPYEILTVSDNKAILTQNHGPTCGTQSEVALDKIATPSFDSLLGFNGSIYEATNDKTKQIEAWCEYPLEGSDKLHLLLETNYVTNQDTAIVIVETWNSVTGQYTSEVKERVPVEQDFMRYRDSNPDATDAYRVRYIKKLDNYPKGVLWRYQYHIFLVVKLYQEKKDEENAYGNSLHMNVTYLDGVNSPYLEGNLYRNEWTGTCRLTGRLDAEAWEKTVAAQK